MGAEGSWTNQVKNLIIVAGTGISGVFVYDPTAGAGNLIASLTDSAKDPYGNVTEKGVSAYVIDVNSIREAVNLNVDNVNGLAGLSIRDTANPPADPPGVYGQGSNGSLKLAVALLDSGLVTGADVDAVVSAQSQTHSGITNGLVQVLAGKTTLGNTPTVTVNENATGNPVTITTPAALAGTPAITQTNRSTHAAGNDATAHDITVTWTIPAADAVAGTVYTLRGHITVNTGQTTIETLTLGIDLNSATTALATLGTAFNGGALNTSYDIPFELRIVADANGADTPQVTLNATLADLSANRLATNSANMHGHANALTFTKANANTIALYAQWGGAGGSAQNAQTIWSELVREGP